MRRCLIICALLLAGCGRELPPVTAAPPPIPADLLKPAPGWTGPTPYNEGTWGDAAWAEKRGRLQCNGQLLTIDQITNPERYEMPLLTITEADGVVPVGPLDADTDFQLRDGSCMFSPNSPGGDLNAGFDRAAHGDKAEFFAATGKTVYIWTTSRCTLFYGSLA
jgi:hypothetical protein